MNGKPTELYRPSLALLTDLYQLTMAYGYWKLGRCDEQAVFHLDFRSNPFGGGYTVVAGLEAVCGFIANLRFEAEDIDYLAGLESGDGKPLFDHGFLDHLANLELSCDIDAMPEGTVAFPYEPLLRVTGPILQCQLLETPLLNLVNFPTLIATKASRICAAARGEPVLEFGLRRAQGVDGGLTASRAAYIGGCAGTSNVLAGRLFGIPVKGTHAHSWVMSFDDELESFARYADVMPANCIFLVDTYDTLEGVRRAVEVGQRLRTIGHDLTGIRLDSGDLTYLSAEARRILDQAGFTQTRIVASGDLDEHIIESLKEQGAAITVWGVGTRLVTAYDQPALGGVYKLSVLRRPGGEWEPRLKLSEQTSKVSTPGILQVRRFTDAQQFVADMVYDLRLGVSEPAWIVDPADPNRGKKVEPGTGHTDLLTPIVRQGAMVYEAPPLGEVRDRARTQIESLHPAIRRFMNPHTFPAGLEQELAKMRQRLIRQARGLPE